ncbi:MAG: LysR substrate-binding domain-containing protein [Rhodococcus sp. (in: high G+C Gram-positive bacteria)]
MTDATVLRWYVAVAEMLAFGRAAKTLNISRQRLSAAVQDLEGEVGARLFVAGDGPTELTDAGRSLLAHARAVVAEDDRARGEAAAAVPARPTLKVGFVPGVTVTKWTRIWAERVAHTILDGSVVEEDEQIAALRDGRVDMCFVREPADTGGLHCVPLYSEVAVVVVPKDHPVSAYDAVTLGDLAGETMQDRDHRVGGSVETTLEMVAAGVGPVLLPHSLARLHSRKDLLYRPVTDADPTRIFLAWPMSQPPRAEDGFDLAQEFLGVVRGRSVRSSRAAADQTGSPRKKKPPAARPAAKRTPAPRRRR